MSSNVPVLAVSLLAFSMGCGDERPERARPITVPEMVKELPHEKEGDEGDDAHDVDEERGDGEPTDPRLARPEARGEPVRVGDTACTDADSCHTVAAAAERAGDLATAAKLHEAA